MSEVQEYQVVPTANGGTVEVWGYIHRHTNVMLKGFHAEFDVVANPEHVDNRGRMETFGPGSEEAQLDWMRITSKEQWDHLAKEHGFEEPEPITERKMPYKKKAKPAPKASTAAAAALGG